MALVGLDEGMVILTLWIDTECLLEIAVWVAVVLVKGRCRGS
jgi:hypothetical protein